MAGLFLYANTDRGNQCPATCIGHIPGRGSQFAAVEADIAQDVIVEAADAGELRSIAEVLRDGADKRCDEQDMFPGVEHEDELCRCAFVASIR